MKAPRIYNKLKQKADFKAIIQASIVTAPLVCQSLLKITRGGAMLPLPLRVAVLAVPVGVKLAVCGYGLHKVVKNRQC